MLVQTETPRRRRYQRGVERLLEQIQRQVQELRRLASLFSAGTPTGPGAVVHP